MAKSRYVTLDAMRGVAALMVVWYHLADAGWTVGAPFGFLAVDLFFVLSGFVLAFRYDAQFAEGLRPSVFMRARIVRLYPLFFIGLVIGLVAEVDRMRGGLSPLKFLLGTAANLFLLPAPGLHGSDRLFPADTPAWSLFFELFVANLAFALFWRSLRGRRLLAPITLGALGLCAILLWKGGLDGGSKWATAPVGTARVLFSFFVGVGLARLHRRFPPRIQAPSWLFPLLIVALLSTPAMRATQPVVSLLAVALVFPTMVYWGASAKERDPRLGRTLGDISYAVYTVHVPLLFLATHALQHFGRRPGSVDAIAFIVAVGAFAFVLDKLYDPAARRLLHRVLPHWPASIGVRVAPWVIVTAAVAACAPIVGYGLSAREPAAFRARPGRRVCASTAGYADGPGGARTFLTRADVLAALRADPRTRLTPEYAALISAANAALARPAPSVIDKSVLPPSGDKHDYISLSTYSWRDPAHPGRSVWRDGQYNPDTYTGAYDYRRLQLLVDDAQALGLAYAYTGDKRYAAKLATNVRRWFIAPDTRMNPNLHFAQVDAVGALGNGNGLIDSWHLVFVVEALGLIGPSGELSGADQAALRAWFTDYLGWLQTSAEGRHELNALNNHADFYDLQRTEYALYTGQAGLAWEFSRATARRRLSQITAWGALPAEERRAKAAHYVSVTLRVFTELATLGECSGVDIWRSHAMKGGRLRAMLDRASGYATGRTAWPGGSPPTNSDPARQAFAEAARAYDDRRYLAAAQSFHDSDAATDEDFRWGGLTTPVTGAQVGRR